MEFDARLNRDLSAYTASMQFGPPLQIDAWLASSLLQKAIRRSEILLAQRAALAFHRARGAAIWRRFQIIAFEDVGAGSIEAVAAASASSDPTWRAQQGGDLEAIRFVVEVLANAPKDRSAEHIIRLCRDFANFERARETVGAQTIPKRLKLIGDVSLPLHVRATAAWFASGLDVGDEKRVGSGNLTLLLEVLRATGIPEPLITATGIAARKTREPICLMVPLIWQEASNRSAPNIGDEPVLSSPTISGIPAYAWDKHTARGKAAIHRLGRENDVVRKVLETHVPEHRAQQAVCMAAFYADAAPVSRRLDWTGSRELEKIGTEQDLIAVGVEPCGVWPLLRAVKDNLNHLNALRAELVIGSKEG